MLTDLYHCIRYYLYLYLVLENVNLDEDLKANYTKEILKLGLLKKEQAKVTPKKAIKVE